MGSFRDAGARQLRAEQAQAAALPVSAEQKDLMKQFSFDLSRTGGIMGVGPNSKLKNEVKLVKFDPNAQGGPSFEFQQGQAVFGVGSFGTQAEMAKKFDPNKPFDIVGGGETPTLVQGDLKFTIPNPVAIRKLDEVVAATSPNAAPGQQLPRLPKFSAGGTGEIAKTASSRAVSAAGVNSRRKANTIQPLLAGY